MYSLQHFSRAAHLHDRFRICAHFIFNVSLYSNTILCLKRSNLNDLLRILRYSFEKSYILNWNCLDSSGTFFRVWARFFAPGRCYDSNLLYSQDV